jgi:hypothetical protein
MPPDIEQIAETLLKECIELRGWVVKPFEPPPPEEGIRIETPLAKEINRLLRTDSDRPPPPSAIGFCIRLVLMNLIITACKDWGTHRVGGHEPGALSLLIERLRVYGTHKPRGDWQC